jgi:hypothetical protein
VRSTDPAPGRLCVDPPARKDHGRHAGGQEHPGNADLQADVFCGLTADPVQPGQAVAVAMRGQVTEAATAHHPYFWAGPQVTGR